ncbi:protein SpAN-like isoform X2 [Actinia tenebrosa]|uniref:Metalloendopeptidase n=1 Tax=Actinia tenebrosa TaxID=6105 RepID=A0A6P8HA17_ACTTE|nr:protein SpAN-like isoform X2 [Actinia tenebrosa]
MLSSRGYFIGYLLAFIAFHLAVMSHCAAVPSKAPANPAVPPSLNGGPKPVFDVILKANKKQAAFRTSGEELFQGDIVVDSQIRTYLASIGANNTTSGSRTKRAAMRNTRARWITNGRAIVPYVIERSNYYARGVILQAMRHWESKVPCIKFTPWNRRQRTYLSFFSGGGCYSHVGRQSAAGAQRISIGRGCNVMGVVAHEIAHALGFWHEQSRPDRDRYVTINWRNIASGVRHNFNKYSTSMINSRGVSYDYDSLMHYSAGAFTVNGRPTIVAKGGRRRLGQRYGLTSKDIQQAKLMYCGSNPRPQTPRPPRPPTPPPPGCQYTDKAKYCSFWKTKGYCTSSQYRSFMMKDCKKTCLCRQTVSCKDDNSKCTSWTRYCNHQTYGPYVRSVCKKTCKRCS